MSQHVKEDCSTYSSVLSVELEEPKQSYGSNLQRIYLDLLVHLSLGKKQKKEIVLVNRIKADIRKMKDINALDPVSLLSCCPFFSNLFVDGLHRAFACL